MGEVSEQIDSLPIGQGWDRKHYGIGLARKAPRKYTQKDGLMGRIINGDPAEKLEQLPDVEEILIYDCRSLEQKKSAKWQKPLPIPATLKCIQWNIERGYKLDKVIKVLKRHNADIICLQELDIHCARSDYRNCALEIAAALEMKCAFVTEFIEIFSPLRTPGLQGGGVHGNAILSRFNFEPRSWAHSHQPVDWEKDGSLIGEPRRGARVIVAADLCIPGIDSPVLCYSLHFEVFTGILGRIRQLADVFEDSRKYTDSHPRQLVFGDLNTMAHGIARLSPRYCRDGMRFGSLGYSEAAWWEAHILSNTKEVDRGLEKSVEISEDEKTNLVNPHFYDPFCVYKDTTLQGYYGLFTGKLDWALLRGWHVLGKGMDNIRYECSDHKLLHVILRPVECSGEDDIGKVAFDENHSPLKKPSRLSNPCQVAAIATLFGITAIGLTRFLSK